MRPLRQRRGRYDLSPAPMFTAFVTTVIHVPGTVRFVYRPNLCGHGDRMRVEHRSVAFDPDSPQRAFLLLPKLREGRPKPTLAGSQRSQGPRRIGRPSVQSGILGRIGGPACADLPTRSRPPVFVEQGQWDSNPRACYRHWFSRPAHSSALPCPSANLPR